MNDTLNEKENKDWDDAMDFLKLQKELNKAEKLIKQSHLLPRPMLSPYDLSRLVYTAKTLSTEVDCKFRSISDESKMLVMQLIGLSK